MRVIHDENVYGVDVDHETRCIHYNGEFDMIAIKFKCCDRWFPCFECHAATADHEAMTWPKSEWDATAILCGRCGHQLSIEEYFACDSTCTQCRSGFNPGCANHYHLYFAT